MELRHLQYFLAVARTLHFSAAAEALGIATPTLSVQIKQLETEIGTALFFRTKRRVKLTQAGEIFRQEAEATVQQATLALERGKSAARGEIGYIRVGYITATLWSGTLTEVFTPFRLDYPDVTITTREILMDMQPAQLLEGKIDIGFVRGPLLLPTEIDHLVVQRDKFCLAMSSAHPLAVTGGDIAPEQLANERIILPEQPFGGEEIARRGGFKLTNASRPGSLMEMLARVSINEGVAVIPAVLTHTIHLPNIAYRDIATPVIPSEIWMLYRKWERSAVLKKLVQMTKKNIQPGELFSVE